MRYILVEAAYAVTIGAAIEIVVLGAFGLMFLVWMS